MIDADIYLTIITKYFLLFHKDEKIILIQSMAEPGERDMSDHDCDWNLKFY